jgi:hypothetical protein
MGIDAQGNIRLGMPEPLGNRHDIHARVDKLRGMGVAQVVEAHIRPEVVQRLGIALLRGQGTVNAGKQQGIVRSLPRAEFPRRVDQEIGQGDVPAVGLRFRCLGPWAVTVRGVDARRASRGLIQVRSYNGKAIDIAKANERALHDCFN